ncbi:MAG: transcriptional elongation/antitermination factor NusG-like protein, partial [Flavobacteriales bacterium]|nr:transcriptional elongation/antitermination factor NusG-like protein [Flavobacteriales bacterium]
MVDTISKNWFVIYTKPRQELKVLERLTHLGIEAYTPTKIEVRKWSDRKKKVTVCLLPSMVLVCLEEKEVSKVFEV